jgi:hypothetical protein
MRDVVNDLKAIDRQIAALGHARKSNPTTLYDACRLVGCDDDGKRCAKCQLLDRCLDDTQWLVRKN